MNNLGRERDWRSFRQQAMVDPDAAEKGRLLAAHQIANDPEARKRVEDEFGVAACAAQWPEAYRYTGRFGGVARVLDSFRDSIPW